MNHVLPGDEDLARSTAIVSMYPSHIQREYKKIMSTHWLCPCVECGQFTQRLAKINSYRFTRAVAYVCNQCILDCSTSYTRLTRQSHPRLTRESHTRLTRERRSFLEGVRESLCEGDISSDEEENPEPPRRWSCLF